MSEMKLIMERWDKYLVEQSPTPEVTVGDFVEAFQKYKPGVLKKVLGNKLFQRVLGIGAGLTAGAATSAALPVLPAAAAAGTVTAVALGITVEQAFGKIADMAPQLGNWVEAMSRRQVDDDSRAGLDLYYDIDDSYEKLIGGIDSPVGKDFSELLQSKYQAAFEQFRVLENAIKAISDTEEKNRLAAELLASPLSKIGINKSADALFKHMLSGADNNAKAASMGDEKVTVQKI